MFQVRLVAACVPCSRVLFGGRRWLDGRPGGGCEAAEGLVVVGVLPSSWAQVRAQAPSCRVRPRLSSRRRFRAALRLWSQALFLVTPR